MQSFHNHLTHFYYSNAHYVVICYFFCEIFQHCVLQSGHNGLNDLIVVEALVDSWKEIFSEKKCSN